MIRTPPRSTLFPYTTLSDLSRREAMAETGLLVAAAIAGATVQVRPPANATPARRSEEHTLNSSHVEISYAVFCLKKKKIIAIRTPSISDYYFRKDCFTL